jgi:hypothetical protein
MRTLYSCSDLSGFKWRLGLVHRECMPPYWESLSVPMRLVWHRGDFANSVIFGFGIGRGEW